MSAQKGHKLSSYAQAPPLAQAQRWDLNVVLVWLFCGYLALVPVADVLLRWSSMTSAGPTLNWSRALFTAVNALTLTGFQNVVGVTAFEGSGKALILLLTLIGSVFPLIVGGLAVVRIVGLPYSDKQVVQSAFITSGLLILLGCLPLIEAKVQPIDALMLSASAFGNSGLYFAQLPGVLAWQTHLVLLPLAVLGGLGLPVLMELFDLLRLRRPLSFYSRTVLHVTAGLYVVFLLLFLAARWINLEAAPEGPELGRLVASSSVAAINSRGAGFAFQFVQEFPRMMQWLLIPLLLIGGSPAGTAGGIKTTTLAELIRGARKALKGEAPGRPFGLALGWVAIYLGFMGFIFLFLLWTDPQVPADRLLLETVSAVGNVGLSFDQITIVAPGLDVISAAMLMGRLMPLLMLWWMAQTTEGAELPIGG